MIRRCKSIFKILISKILPLKLRLFFYKASRGLLLVSDVDDNMFYHIKMLKNIGFNPDVVIDIGAYLGDWTFQVNQIFPNATFLMIEPQKSKESF